MLSIIIPTLNEEKILEQTLTALRNLTVVDYEIIVSDGFSTDKTLEIADRFSNKVVRHDGSHRQTIAEGRNAGAAAAGGEYLLFIDADVFIPDINAFVPQAIENFERNQTLKGLTVFLKVLPQQVTLSDKLFFSCINRSNQFFNNFLHSGVASGEFMMMPAESFKRVGGFNPKLVMGEDNDLFSRLSKIGKTRVDTGLHVMHTSRRAHNMGWIPLLTLWWANMLFNKFFHKSLSKEWSIIR